MKKGIKLDLNKMEHAVLGGAILGGGGGGAATKGRKFATMAVEYTDLRLVSIEDIDPDALILTASMVGAPGAKDQYISAGQVAKTIELFRKNCDVKLGGIITNENGGSATVNGWLQAALTGLPLVDAPCNGRAHPTGIMGSMDLHLDPEYITTQCFAGGNPELGMEVDGVATGTIDHTSKLVRMASVEAGGTVTVARNPVPASYVKKHAAVGGVSHAIEVGEVYANGLKTSVDTALKALCELLDGEIIASGKVEEFVLRGEGGFDVGRMIINGHELTYWNEYMTVEVGDKRLYTFPDLIMTFDLNTGEPLTTAMLEDGMDVAVFCTDVKNIKVSTTMHSVELMKSVEPIIGKEIAKYLK